MSLSHMLRVFLLTFACMAFCFEAHAGGRMEQIRSRGYLVCGVAPNDAGFSVRQADGQFVGFEVDLCRAIASAIFGTSIKTHFKPLDTVHEFLEDGAIDLVFHRLTWTLTREAPGQLEFGTVYFYERSSAAHPEPLAPLLRADDADFARIVRWAVYALLDAELYVNSIALWPPVGSGEALGLRADWAANMVAQVGHYGEIFERHFGPGSTNPQDRGINRLWRDGGLFVTPLFK
jgi:hypothetical protein